MGKCSRFFGVLSLTVKIGSFEVFGIFHLNPYLGLSRTASDPTVGYPQAYTIWDLYTISTVAQDKEVTIKFDSTFPFTDQLLWDQRERDSSSETSLIEPSLIKNSLSYFHPLTPAGSFSHYLFFWPPEYLWCGNAQLIWRCLNLHSLYPRDLKVCSNLYRKATGVHLILIGNFCTHSCFQIREKVWEREKCRTKWLFSFLS